MGEPEAQLPELSEPHANGPMSPEEPVASASVESPPPTPKTPSGAAPPDTPTSPTTPAGGPKFTWNDKATRQLWESFAKFGNASASEITGKNFDKWLKDAQLFDKNLTTTTTGIAFSKCTGPKRKTLSYKETKKVILLCAEEKAKVSKQPVQDELDAICTKLAALEGPSRGGTTKASSSGVFDRLTDSTKYTGSHKERFDSAGKGRGKAGRADTSAKDGYVAGYRNRGAQGGDKVDATKR